MKLSEYMREVREPLAPSEARARIIEVMGRWSVLDSAAEPIARQIVRDACREQGRELTEALEAAWRGVML